MASLILPAAINCLVGNEIRKKRIKQNYYLWSDKFKMKIK